VLRRLALLAENPRPANAQRLTGALRGGLRLRVGDYRAGLEIDDRAHVVMVWLIGHRSRFYDEALRRWPPV
jgi:mRNA-degrading endonuclease RelE of RelBE toxin-antitoxin system